jgi:hypothetical protein
MPFCPSTVHSQKRLLHRVATGCCQEFFRIPDRHLARIPFERIERVGDERIQGHRLGAEVAARLLSFPNSVAA